TKSHGWWFCDEGAIRPASSTRSRSASGITRSANSRTLRRAVMASQVSIHNLLTGGKRLHAGRYSPSSLRILIRETQLRGDHVLQGVRASSRPRSARSARTDHGPTEAGAHVVGPKCCFVAAPATSERLLLPAPGAL